MNLSRLADALWWKSAAVRALYTAIAIALPYLGGSLLTEVPWVTVASAAVLGAIASLATSLAGLPEASGVDLPWWLAAVERTAKTFGQALAAGLIGPVLISDVDWLFVLQAAALAALVSLLRLVLATLPADPTASPVTQVNHFHTTVANEIAKDTSARDAAAQAAANQLRRGE